MKNRKDAFWISYGDIMTSLFFLMLILFGLYHAKVDASLKELKEIRRIQKALEKLDTRYFTFDSRNKRYRLVTDVNFQGNSSSILDIPFNLRKDVLEAGRSIYKLMETLTKENPNVNYLLIIEGNTQRSQRNWLNIPDVGYKLSYERALSLVNYWNSNGVDFKKFDNCEILISGSGYFGRSRGAVEFENRKFTIQITPKIGEMIDLKKK